MSYSISSPARFCEERNAFETLDVIVDVDGGTVDLISENKKSVIRLDLVCVDTLEEILHEIVNNKRFRSALREKLLNMGAV